MTTAKLIAAHEAHLAAVAAFDAAHPFDFFAPLDAPQAPAPSPQAEAGRRIVELGLPRALAQAITTCHGGPIDDYERSVQLSLALAAAVEA